MLSGLHRYIMCLSEVWAVSLLKLIRERDLMLNGISGG